jgi:hypothetical protein
MSTKHLAIALASLALMSATASAQVGIRIGGGGIGLGIMAAPLIGRDRSNKAERYRAPQRTERARRKRSNDDDDVKTAKKTPASQEAPASQESNVATGLNENSSISSSVADKPTNAPLTATADLGNTGTPQSNENSTITSAASSPVVSDPVKTAVTPAVTPPVTTAETDGSGTLAATCKRYFPTVGQTLTVPCN